MFILETTFSLQRYLILLECNRSERKYSKTKEIAELQIKCFFTTICIKISKIYEKKIT